MTQPTSDSLVTIVWPISDRLVTECQSDDIMGSKTKKEQISDKIITN